MGEIDEYDAVIIGSGPAGYVAAIRAAQLGLKVAIVEKEKTLGGTCLNVGCIPSKALLQSTELFSKLSKEGKLHGIEFSDLKINFPQMMQRKNHVVEGLVKGIAGLMKRNQITCFEGVGTLTSANTVKISSLSREQEIKAGFIILATGSEPISLPFLPFDEKIVLSSTGALALSEIPKKLLVVGGGIIGVELASVYSRLGSEVTVIEMLDRICPMLDISISKAFLQILKKQGINFLLSTTVTKVKMGENDVSLFMTSENRSSVVTGQAVLVAVGRRPFSKALGLAEHGIALSPQGFVLVNGEFQTSVPHIYAIGDLVEGPMLAHRAFDEAMTVAELIAGQKPHPVDYLTIPNVIYTYPEVAFVGLTEKEARDAGLDVKVGTFPFQANPRARCSGDEVGLVKVIGDGKSGRLIGLHIIGAHASEMIGEGMIAMKKKATLADLAYAPQPHPTLSEAIKEAALDALLGKALHL